jgi:putative SOS response-associated peptidase YedK
MNGRRPARRRRPTPILPQDEPLFAFAGLWENWRDRSGGAEWIRTCTIVTGAANLLLQPIHARMPIILDRSAWSRWLGEEAATQDELLSLLRPFPAERMRVFPISSRVNSVRNDDAGLIDPLMATGGIAV